MTLNIPSDSTTNIQMLLRWIHFLAGITWIGLLYFFNLVNVDFMKSLDAATKTKVVPQLMPRALWWFRWGAVVTVLSGLLYYAIILMAEPGGHLALLKWLGVVFVVYGIIYRLLRPTQGALNKGPVLAWAVSAVVVVMSAFVVLVNGQEGASSRSLSIGIGGGLGFIMLANVWMIIWPNQRKIIAWTKDAADKGTAMPPEAATLTRQAFLASRANAWLSLPMLFFMGAASHYPLFG